MPKNMKSLDIFSTIKLAFLDNMEALFITQVNVTRSDRPQATKMWEWK